LLSLPLAAAAFDNDYVEGYILAPLDVGNRSPDLIIFALTLLQESERNSNDFSRLFKHASRNLRVNKLLLLRGKLDHCGRSNAE
jgi:hypothetical protein